METRLENVGEHELETEKETILRCHFHLLNSGRSLSSLRRCCDEDSGDCRLRYNNLARVWSGVPSANYTSFLPLDCTHLPLFGRCDTHSTGLCEPRDELVRRDWRSVIVSTCVAWVLTK
jgi:hypothetical protein